MRTSSKSTALFSAACAAFLTVAASAADLPRTRPDNVGMSAERLERISAYAARLVEEGQVAGVVTLVARHGQVVHLEATGMADIENRERMTTDAYFRWFSMTKPITSVALLTLYEEGAFQLTDPLAVYLPEFANIQVAVDSPSGSTTAAPARAPTIQDVFRHTAGFTYEGALYDAKSLAELTTRLAARPLAYEPGTRWVYSFSHDVQARLVEVLSGKPFDQYVRERILEPLGMQDTFVGIPANRAKRFTVTYGPKEGGGLMPVDTPEQTSYQQVAFGGTSLAGPIEDYARFAQMLVNGGELDGVRILGPRTVALMATNHLPDGVSRGAAGGGAASGEGYGLGVRVVTDSAKAGNLTSPGTFGWTGAAATHFFVDPKEDLIAVLMIQQQPLPFRMLDEFETLVYQAIVD